LNPISKIILPTVSIIACIGVIIDQLVGASFGLSSIIEDWAHMTIITATLFILLFCTRLISSEKLRSRVYLFVGILSIFIFLLGLFIESREYLSSLATSLIFLCLSIHGYLIELNKAIISRIVLNFFTYSVSTYILILYYFGPAIIYSLAGFESVSWNTALGFLIYTSTLIPFYYPKMIAQKHLSDDFELISQQFVEFWLTLSFTFPVCIIIWVSFLDFSGFIPHSAALALALWLVAIFPFPITYLIYKQVVEWISVSNKQSIELSKKQKDILFYNSLLEEFAQITSHNLRGPAVGLGNITEIAFDESTPKDLKKESLNLLREKIPSLVTTIDRLGDFYNMIKEGELEYEKCNVEEFFLNALTVSKDEFAHIAIEYDLKLDVEEISYPPVYLENIFYNLVSNSIKYRHKNRKLKLSLCTEKLENGGVQIRFIDNGIGMDLKHFGSKIFGFGRSFHNFENSNGIGLFILKNQLNRSRDSIEVQSKENIFTEFVIKIKSHGKKELGNSG